RLGHAYGKLVEALASVQLDLFFRLRGVFDSRAAVYLAHDALDLLLDRSFTGIEEVELAGLLASLDHGFAQGHGTGAALGPVVGDDGIFGSGRERGLAHQLDFGGRIGAEAVHRYHRGDAELAHIFDVPRQVD